MLEQIVTAENLNRAYRRIKENNGSGGVDGMTVGALLPWLAANGARLWRSLVEGTYQPAPARGAVIPKSNGGKRRIGIPTVVDRLIQRAVSQVLTPLYEPKFSDASYAYRPGRSPLHAVLKCREYLNEGYEWTVDMDLEKLFDTVNQKKLMGLLSRDIQDSRVLQLIEKYLHAGVIRRGRFEPTETGVGQGSALSPLLANVMLNELDRELERRGQKFIRYADDIALFCKSRDEAKAALDGFAPYIENELLLKINRDKTTIDQAGDMRFLGYGFCGENGGFRFRVHEQSVKRMKAKILELMMEMEDDDYTKLWQYIAGWVNYYYLADIGKLVEENRGWMSEAVQAMFLRAWERRKDKAARARAKPSVVRRVWRRVVSLFQPGAKANSATDLPFRPVRPRPPLRRIALPAAALLAVSIFAGVNMKYLLAGMFLNGLIEQLRTSL